MNTEFNLVKFPIIFPIIYGILLYQFPNFENYLIFFTLLLLAESHFGATWPFFLNNSNFDFIKKNKFSLIFIPITIRILCVAGFFLFKTTFLLIFFMANMYHVTRQSFGVYKLYAKKIEQTKFQESSIYLLNFIFFLIGFFRFYFPLIKNDFLIYLNILIILLIVFLLLYYFIKYNMNDDFFVFFTGLIIFYPICFVNNPVHAIVMGVTMHYTQYLYLTYKVYLGRRQNKTVNTSKKKFFFIIFLYALLMSIFSLFGKNSNDIINSLIIIPITGQMLHFFLDSQLWKFSVKHNRINILNYLTHKS